MNIMFMKRIINIGNALVAPTKEVMNITIIND